MPANIYARFPFYPPNIKLIISGIFVGVIFAFFLGPYLSLVEQLGFRIPQDDLYMDYITALGWATLLGACIIVFPVRHRDKNMLLWAWFIKCFVSLFVLLFYEAHFVSDAEGYVHSLRNTDIRREVLAANVFSELYRALFHTHTFNTMLWYYSQCIPDFLADSYHSLKITFSMIGLMAVYLFYRTSNIITKKDNRMFFWVLLLFPSLLIYDSRVGKESLMLFSLSIHIAGLVNWHFKRKKIYLFVGLVGLMCCTFLRSWVGGVLTIPLLFYFLRAQKTFLSKTTLSLLAGVLMFVAYSLILEKFDLKGIDEVYSKLEFVARHNDAGGSAINREALVVKGPMDIIKFAPGGIFTALFRPLPWDVSGLLGFLSGMEGLLLLYLFLRAVRRTRFRELDDPVLSWAIVLVLSWGLLYGFAIQNFGTGVRWKTQILPIFLGLLLYLSRFRSAGPRPIGSKVLKRPVLSK